MDLIRGGDDPAALTRSLALRDDVQADATGEPIAKPARHYLCEVRPVFGYISSLKVLNDK